LFEIQHQKRYGVNVYGHEQGVAFLQAASLYHPSTVEASLKHDGSGTEPGIKDLDGHWDLRPHSSRIVRVDAETLASWHAVLETDDVPIAQTRMVYAVNRSTAEVLEKLAAAPRFSTLGLQFSSGWHEKNDRTKGYFDAEWGVPESWDSVILQGPHLFVGTPAYKQPNPSMLNHLDWTEVDLETLPSDSIPATAYKPRGDRSTYDAAYTQWALESDGSVTPARKFYRLAWRNMAANTGERTFIPALIPPGAGHIHGVSSVGLPGDDPRLVAVAGFATSLIHDFAVRIAPKSTISAATLDRLPFLDDPVIRPLILLRTLRLNALTVAYQDLWTACFHESFVEDTWTDAGLNYPDRSALGAVTADWTATIPLRRAADRRQALLEVDALVAIALGIDCNELTAIYRTQFPVLYGYDQRVSYFDRLGRQVPTAVLSKWRQGATDEVIKYEWNHPGSGARYEFEPPFGLLNREADLAIAYSQLQDRVKARRENSA
jgi:hypothetical protein